MSCGLTNDTIRQNGLLEPWRAARNESAVSWFPLTSGPEVMRRSLAPTPPPRVIMLVRLVPASGAVHAGKPQVLNIVLSSASAALALIALDEAPSNAELKCHLPL